MRRQIKDRDCWCTNEIFMWPSIVFQPKELGRALLGGRVWQRPRQALGGPHGASMSPARGS